MNNVLRLFNNLVFLFLVLLVAMLMPVAPVHAQEKVESVRVWKAPDRLRLVFDVSGPVEHSIFTLDNPDRVVIDVQDTQRTRALFDVDLKDGPIRSLRSAERNGNDLRIVLDLSRGLKTKSFLLKPNQQYGHRLVVDLEAKDSDRFAEHPRTVKTLANVGDGRKIMVVIDAGHGGEDPGAIGNYGTHEKDVVLQIARELQSEINRRPGYEAVLTRTGDYFLKLKTRRELARRKYKGDLFLSIHADAFHNKKANGASVFALSRKGATSTLARVLAESENRSDLVGGVSLDDKDDHLAMVLADLSMEGSMEHSLRAGKYVLREMGGVARLHKKHVEQAGFAVLKSPDVPSLLIETGFISNPTEEKNLKSSWYQRKLAQSIANGVYAYFDDYPPPGTYVALQKLEKDQYRSHTIASGETLTQIAEQYRVSTTSLREVNRLTSDAIQVGQVLRIPQS